ncbi:MAG TPA: lytic transglycosylase domain-containing protein [Solirubrobacteraceae bacterium]|nr:lytic transglycosylase domain-containing protein [Solirubrobacteraceae bacterium]
MSTLAAGSQAITPPSELALTARVEQLEALLANARAGFTGGTAAGTTPASGVSSTDFASALQSATAAGTAPATGEAGGQYEGLVAAAAQRNGIDPAILHGLIQQESGFDPSSQSSAGAQGLTQLMPGTASSMGVSNPLDPAESIEGGARYLGQLLKQFGGNTTDALAAYNAGPGAVSQYGGVPPYQETQDYVTKVLGYAEAYRQSHPSPSTGETIA